MQTQNLLILFITAALISSCGSKPATESKKALTHIDSLNKNTCPKDPSDLVDSALQTSLIERNSIKMKFEINKSEDEWKKQLTEEEFNITRNKGTERPFSGKYYNYHEKGIYLCVACGNELFTSDTKYESGSGWPSFWEPIAKDKIHNETDRSFGMTRTEIMCSKCGAHLGHVFDDGPNSTRQRYCINSASLNFKKDIKEK